MKGKDIFEGVDDKRRLNNAQRKAITELMDKRFSIMEARQEKEHQRKKKIVIRDAKKEFNVPATLKKMDKLWKDLEKHKEELNKLGFDDTGAFNTHTSYCSSRNKSVYDNEGTVLYQRVHDLKYPDNKEYQNQINNKLWLAGTVGEARKILNSIK